MAGHGGCDLKPSWRDCIYSAVATYQCELSSISPPLLRKLVNRRPWLLHNRIHTFRAEDRRTRERPKKKNTKEKCTLVGITTGAYGTEAA